VHSRFEQIALAAARVAGAFAGLLAARQAHLAYKEGGPVHLLVFLLLTALSLGLWQLHPIALRVGTVLLVAAAVLAPLGMVNPFHASDVARGADRWFLERTIVLAFGLSAGCLALAFLVSHARLTVERIRRNGSPPT
jgi:hypothetical protein